MSHHTTLSDRCNDEWPSDAEYHQRVAMLCSSGLDVKLSYHNDEGFISLTVEIKSGVRLRDVTPWRLHITLCWDTEVEASLLQQIAAKWHNQETHLKVAWCGSGGTAFIDDCLLSACPLIRSAHSLGWYRDRQLHISF